MIEVVDYDDSLVSQVEILRDRHHAAAARSRRDRR
jgi:hypothetical protein